MLARSAPTGEVWITEAGYSTWRTTSGAAHAFVDALDAPAERVYWYAAEDLGRASAPATASTRRRGTTTSASDARRAAEAAYARLWADGGIEAVRDCVAGLDREPRPARAAAGTRLITGGAGFIGTNLADRLLADGRRVLVFDNLSRPGVEQNLALAARDARRPRRRRDRATCATRARCAQARRAAPTPVFHFAAQVAVTTSLDDPVARLRRQRSRAR